VNCILVGSLLRKSIGKWTTSDPLISPLFKINLGVCELGHSSLLLP